MTKPLRIFTLVCLMVMACCTCAFATDFIDVPANSWFYTYVDELSDQGIINGYGNGCYDPLRNVTHAEALKLALGAADIEIEVGLAAEGGWWKDIVATADKYGLAQAGTFDPAGFATREDICRYLVNAKGWQKASHIQDVFIDTSSDNAEILYQKGIVTGVAGPKGYSFNGAANVTRAETSALIHRTYNFDPLVLRPVMGDAEGFLYQNPVNQTDWEKVLNYMSKNNLFSYSVYYTGTYMDYSNAKQNQMAQNALQAMQDKIYAQYNELYSYTTYISIATDRYNSQLVAKVDLANNDSGFTNEELGNMRKTFFQETEAILRSLIGSGQITADMTEKEKAKVCYDWVCGHCEYDHKQSPVSYFGYAAIHNGKAVCQGYTNLYNTMLKQLGIWCEGVAGESKTAGVVDRHIWTYAMIDGEYTFIDTTFGDKGSEIDYNYFCQNAATFAKDHSWDANTL